MLIFISDLRLIVVIVGVIYLGFCYTFKSVSCIVNGFLVSFSGIRGLTVLINCVEKFAFYFIVEFVHCFVTCRHNGNCDWYIGAMSYNV